jgi:hypothetical protein
VRLLLAIAASLVTTTAAGAQPSRSLPEAAAVFDTATAQLVELELGLVRLYALGRSEVHADAARSIRQIAALRQLLATFPDSIEVNAAIRARLVGGLYARLARVIVDQRLAAERSDSRQPDLLTLRKEDELLRRRLNELGEPGAR